MPKFGFYCVHLLSSLSILSRSYVTITEHPSWMLLDHKRCGHTMSDRIIGGKNATMGAYPWIARIGYRNSEANATVETKLNESLAYKCGGALVNGMYVITAAHCVTDLPGKYKVAGVRLGEHNTETDPDCESGYCAEPVQDFRPEQIIAHREYNEPLYKNDIALIRLDRPVTYNDWVMPICMPSGKLLGKDFVNETAEVAGWGIDDMNKLTSSVVLQTIHLPIVPTEMCAKAFKTYTSIGEEQLCVGGKIGADSCGGDSGGPLMKPASGEKTAPRYYIIGIVSFGAKHCGQTATPAVYTRVSHYVGWILDNISP